MWCRNFLVSAKNWQTWRLDSSWWNSCTYRPVNKGFKDHVRSAGAQYNGFLTKQLVCGSRHSPFAGISDFRDQFNVTSPQQELVWAERSSSQQQWSLRSSETGSALKFLWTTPVSSLWEASFKGRLRDFLSSIALTWFKILMYLQYEHGSQIRTLNTSPFPSAELSLFVIHHFSRPWWGVWHLRRPLPVPSFSLTPPFYSFPIWSASLTASAWTTGRGQAHNPRISDSRTQRKQLHSESESTEFRLLILNKNKACIHFAGDRFNNIYSLWPMSIFSWVPYQKSYTEKRFLVKPHLFEGELKLSCVKEELEEDPGVVLGVIEHLVFNLTQSFVVWIIGCGKTTE